MSAIKASTLFMRLSPALLGSAMITVSVTRSSAANVLDVRHTCFHVAKLLELDGKHLIVFHGRIVGFAQPPPFPVHWDKRIIPRTPECGVWIAPVSPENSIRPRRSP